MATVRNELLHGEHRAVTLVGAAGIGKTTIALEVARQVEPLVPDGVWLVDLSSVGDAEDVPRAIGAVLGLVDEERPLLDLLADHLAARDAALVLEQCERLTPELAGIVDALLDAAPGLLILATSRTPLRVRGEAIHVVPPFSVPAPDVVSIEQLKRFDSVRLFVKRATAAGGVFTLTDASARAVASICRRLDGIPLAIELAAAWSSVLAPAEIEARLAAGGTEVGVATGPAGERMTEATLDWGHGLLAADAQALFRRMAVFADGWTIEAAEAVGSLGGDSSAVLPLLAKLVSHSLVVRKEDRGRSRYRMLTPIADYASRRLDAAGERGPAAMAHATYFLRLSTSPHPEPGQCLPEDIERVAGEFANCLAAIRFAAQAELVPVHLGLVTNLIMPWRVRGHLRLAVEQLEGALAVTSDGSLARGLVHGVLAEFLTLLGDYEAADTQARAGEEVFAALDEPHGIASMIAQRGLAAAGRGDVATALAAFEQARPYAVASGSGIALAYWEAAVGRFELQRDRPEAAEQHLIEADRLFRQRPSWYHGRVLAMLGVIAQGRGDYARAATRFSDGLHSLCAYGATVDAIACIEDTARLAAAQGDWRRAATLLSAATRRRDETACVPSVPDRARLYADTDAVRSNLAPEAFESAWAAGQAMTLEDASAFAAARRTAPPPMPDAATGSTLTPREREIAGLVALGLSNRAIADRLVIAPGTVKIHVERILGKLGRTSRVQIATWAQSDRELAAGPGSQPPA